LESSSCFCSTFPLDELLFSAEVSDCDEDWPEVALPLPPPLPELLAVSVLAVLPPVAVAPLLFDPLPLSVAV
jgi:hypothetical protein